MVVVVLEGVREREGVMSQLPEPADLAPVLVGHIRNVLADSVPAYALLLFELVREAEGLHAVVVQGVWLGKVEHIELDPSSALRVADTEEVPLRMTVSVDVILQDEVVFVLADLDRGQQVPRLEARFKYERRVLRARKLVELRRRVLDGLLHMTGAHRFEVALFSLEVMFLDQFFNIDQVRGGAEIVRRLVGGREVTVFATLHVKQELLTEAAVDKCADLPGIQHVILDGLRGSDRDGAVALRISSRASLGSLVSGTAVVRIEQLGTLAAHEPAVLDECNACA